MMQSLGNPILARTWPVLRVLIIASHVTIVDKSKKLRADWDEESRRDTGVSKVSIISVPESESCEIKSTGALDTTIVNEWLALYILINATAAVD